MRQTCTITRRPANRQLALFLTVSTIGLLCSGCFVIRHEQFSKPVGSAESVKFHTIEHGCETYSRLLSGTDLNVEVSVANWPSGWELQFLFNIIPIYRYHYGNTEPLCVEMKVEPRTLGLILDPGQICFLGADQARLPPTKTWKTWHHRSAELSTGEVVPITSCTTFHLEFPVEHRAYPEHDLPFQLSMDGLSLAGRAMPMPLVTFEPKTMTRPAFRLPY